MKTRAITEGALMAALTIVCALLSYYVPFLSVFSYLLLPLPTIILYKRHGFTPALLESIASTICLALFMDIFSAILQGVNIILPGLMLGYGYREDKTGGYRVLLGFFAYLATYAVELILFERLTGISAMEDFINSINEMTNMMSGIYAQSGMYDASQLKTLDSTLDQVNETIKMLYPTMIILIPAIMSWLIVKLDDIIFRRLNLSYKPVPPMTQWRIPRTAKNILALVVIVSIIAGHFITNPVLEVYPYTFEAISTFIFMIMGFAFIFWLIQKRFGKPMIFLRILVVILSMIFTVLVSIIVFLGMLDVYFDLRRFLDKREIQ